MSRRTPHDLLAQGRAVLAQAISTMRGNDDQDSAQHLITGLRAIRAARRLGAGHDPDLAWVRHYSALAAYRVGRIGMAGRLAQQGLDGFALHGDVYGQACAHNLLGVMALEGGALPGAYAAFRQADDLEGGEHVTLKGKILTNLSLTALSLGDHETALRWSQQALDHCRAAGDREGVARTLLNSVELTLQLGHFSLAQDYTAAALTLAEELGAHGMYRTALLAQADLHARAGDHAQACTWARRSLSLAHDSGNPNDEARAWAQLGESLLGLGQARDALAALTQALALAHSLGALGEGRSAAILSATGRALTALGHWDQGREALHRAITLSHARRDLVSEAASLHAISALEAAAGRYPEALDFFQRYHALDRATSSAQRTRITEALMVTHEIETHRQLTQQLTAANAGLRHAADHDPLTDALNRRALAVRAEDARNAGEPGAALLLDLDHFKAVNDTFGHDVGDQVLITVTRLIRAELREGDLLARWGGEEFLAVLPGCPPHGAGDAATRIVAVTAAYDWAAVAPGLQVTLSVGVASGDGGEALSVLIRRADAALYAAKRGGRNAVVLAEADASGGPTALTRP